MTNAGLRRGGGEPGRRLMIDDVVERRAAQAELSLQSGEMDQRVDAVEQRRPIERFSKIRVATELDIGRKRRRRRAAGGGAYGKRTGAARAGKGRGWQNHYR